MKNKENNSTPFEVARIGHELDDNNYNYVDPRVRYSPLSKTIIIILISASISVSCLASDIYYPNKYIIKKRSVTTTIV